jgi:hypothetical protein
VPGLTVTLLADRRTEGALDVARALAARLREADGALLPVVLIADPAFPAKARNKGRDPGEIVGPASVPALLGRLPLEGHAVLSYVGPLRQQVVAALDRSNLVVLLTDMAVASLRAARRTLRLLTDVGYPVDKVAVAVVPASAAELVDRVALRAALSRDVAHVLPRGGSGPDAVAAYDALIARIRRA